MITLADKQFYAAEITAAIDKLARHYGVQITSPAIYWDLKGKSRLGVASGLGLYIKLNPQYASLLGREEFRKTALHEACHIVTTQRRKLSPGADRTGRWSSHGAEWKAAMRFLGLPPDRCAAIPSDIVQQVKPARRVVRFPVYCLCPTPHQVTRQMYDKINRGATCRCNTCKVVVTPNKGAR